MEITITDTERKELTVAVQLLENPGLAAKITNLVGRPVEKGFDLLPAKWSSKIGEITKQALLKASEAAIFTLKDNPDQKSSNIRHKMGAAISGGIGGFFGLPALAIELPVSTTIMLRSIAEIARSYGESVKDHDTKLACLEVFALGGKVKSDDGAESGYFLVRTALAKSISEAAQFLATKTLSEEGAPAIIRLISNIAQRFSIQITEKTAAQSLPVIGAAGGAVINTIFMNHFQDMAKGHFIVRKLERTYGKETIKALYDEINISLHKRHLPK